MYNILNTALFGIVTSIIAYDVGLYINKKFKSTILNPLLISIILIISFLLIKDIPYENYKIGGDVINFFLGPVTIVLAVPLYKQLNLLKKYMIPILVGITVGVIISFICIIIIGVIMNADIKVLKSVIPKSITTPMGVSLSNSIGGIESITVVSIIITGILGSIIAEPIFKIAKINNPIAKGIGIGTSSHAVGTSKAMEIGEVEGAISGLSIGISGIITVVLIPILLKLFV